MAEQSDTSGLTSTFSIWPPSSRTREAVVRRLVDTLTNDTVLSKRYGAVPSDEAEISAEAIEKAAFEAASVESERKAKEGDGSVEAGIVILQVYSKEVSSRMLETAKARAGKDMEKDPKAGAVTAEVGSE